MELGSIIATGNTADIYLAHNRIIKLYHQNAEPIKADTEAKKQQKVYDNGLLVPKIIEVTEYQHRQALVMEYIEGEN